MDTGFIVALDLLVILLSLGLLGWASLARLVKHTKLAWDVFFFGFIFLFFGVGNMLDKLKVIPSDIVIFLPISMLIAMIIYGLIFVSRRTAASKGH